MKRRAMEIHRRRALAPRRMLEALEDRRMLSGGSAGEGPGVRPVPSAAVGVHRPVSRAGRGPGGPVSAAPAAPVPAPSGLMGDLDGDFAVTHADFRILNANFGGTGAANGDINRDGTIDFADFQLMERNFGAEMRRPDPPPTPSHYAYVATNLDGISDWGTIGAFANLARTFRPWGTTELPYTPDPELPLTDDGYPLADAGTVTYAYSYPDGVYEVSWEGSGELSFTGMGADFTITSHEGDSWTAELELDRDAGELLTMYVRDVDPANPLRDLKIMSPDVNYALSGTFRPVFLQKLEAFNGPLRMMDWAQTNNQAAVDWADRAEPTNFTYTEAAGVDYETMIELANLTGKDLWVCVPHLASDDYVRQMARLFAQRLNLSNKLYVENSNEVWNPTFLQMRDNQAAARRDRTLTVNDDFGRQAQRAGKEIVRISNLFRQEYNAHLYAWQVRPVLGAFIASDYWASTALNYIRQTYGQPRDFIHAIAIAPYVGNSGDMAEIDNDQLTLDTLFDWMHDRIDGQVVTWVRQHKEVADRFGIKLHSYEAGQHLQALDGTNEELKLAAQSDPRMGDVYEHLIRAWHENSGGGIFGNFSLATPPSRFGHWGLLTSIDQPTSVKWEAVMEAMGTQKYPG